MCGVCVCTWECTTFSCKFLSRNVSTFQHKLFLLVFINLIFSAYESKRDIFKAQARHYRFKKMAELEFKKKIVVVCQYLFNIASLIMTTSFPDLWIWLFFLCTVSARWNMVWSHMEFFLQQQLSPLPALLWQTIYQPACSLLVLRV